MKTKILLIAEPGPARDAYVDVLHKLDVLIDCIASPDEITEALVDASYSGLLVDVPTMIRCQCPDKNRITRIMERFPVLRLMFNQAYGGIRGMAHGGTIKDNRSLEEFILYECVPFIPRSIRVAERKDIVFNVRLMDELDHLERAELTVTTNVSEHGCFVYSVKDWIIDAPAWMVVNEFEDHTPIELKVCWLHKWGETMAVPGIGVRFESMTTHQYVQLHSYL